VGFDDPTAVRPYHLLFKDRPAKASTSEKGLSSIGRSILSRGRSARKVILSVLPDNGEELTVHNRGGSVFIYRVQPEVLFDILDKLGPVFIPGSGFHNGIAVPLDLRRLSVESEASIDYKHNRSMVSTVRRFNMLEAVSGRKIDIAIDDLAREAV